MKKRSLLFCLVLFCACTKNDITTKQMKTPIIYRKEQGLDMDIDIHYSISQFRMIWKSKQVSPTSFI